LLFWYLLAQGMENASIIPMPPDYEMSAMAEEVFDDIKELEFQQQITFLRDLVSPMGIDPTLLDYEEAIEL
ncbi:MAG: orange carotenoid protein N-terminal domain-containing protein, partial [Leptolyngbyaceae bacterium]|nr:orange carotenoid protein N-terminal domain-containing protein [Leptolyngbyaceae bacterium]